MPTAYLLDYGGTLDTGARHWCYVLHEGLEAAGLTLPLDSFRPAYVYAERQLAKFPYITQRDDFLSLLQKKITLEVEYLVHTRAASFATYADRAALIRSAALYCNAYARKHVQASLAVIKALHQKGRVVIVSNFYGNLPTILNTFGVTPHIDAVVESARVGVRKPNPAIWLLGAQAAATEPAHCIAVGDSFTKDILSARTAGMQTVWYSGEEWDSQAQYDTRLPNHIIHDLHELAAL